MKSTTNLFSKGNRVEWKDGNDTIYGTVKTIRGSNLTAIVDGGRRMCRGHFSCFTVSKTRVRVDSISTPADIYMVTRYKPMAVVSGRWRGHEGNGLECRVAKNNVEIIEVYNDGVGGPNQYQRLPGGTQKDLDDFKVACDAWFFAFTGNKAPYGNCDLWIGWVTDKKPYNVTAEEYLKVFKVE